MYPLLLPSTIWILKSLACWQTQSLLISFKDLETGHSLESAPVCAAGSVLRKKVCRAKNASEYSTSDCWIADLLLQTVESLQLQSPARAACGNFSHGHSPACLIFHSACMTSCQPLWLTAAHYKVTNQHYIMHWWWRRGELKWHSSLQQVMLTQRPRCACEPLEQRPLLQAPKMGRLMLTASWAVQRAMPAITGAKVCCRSMFGIFHSQESYPEIRSKLNCSYDKALHISAWSFALGGPWDKFKHSSTQHLSMHV